jgi:uncharacterized protein YbgA (DUF1722 family)
VLQHLSGYFKTQLNAASRQELDRHVQGYRRGELPLAVPLTLLKHHLRAHPDAYLAAQVYLEPHPRSAR